MSDDVYEPCSYAPHCRRRKGHPGVCGAAPDEARVTALGSVMARGKTEAVAERLLALGIDAVELKTALAETIRRDETLGQRDARLLEAVEHFTPDEATCLYHALMTQAQELRRQRAGVNVDARLADAEREARAQRLTRHARKCVMLALYFGRVGKVDALG